MFVRSRWLPWAIALVALSLLVAACAPAAQPTAVPPTPTKAPAAQPTAVPPTPTKAPAAQPTPTQAPAAPTAAPAPTKAPATGIPAIPHTLEERADCLLCHKAGGLKPFPANHAGRTNDICQGCHKPK